MDKQLFETDQKLAPILLPYARGKLDTARKANKRFVHYSSAENIFKIISSKAMWMRNARAMVDYSEIENGYLMLHQFFGNRPNHDAFF